MNVNFSYYPKIWLINNTIIFNLIKSVEEESGFEPASKNECVVLRHDWSATFFYYKSKVATVDSLVTMEGLY